MAFQFPNPTVTPEFTGDNGITYSWDATDGKWVVKTTAALEDIRQDIIELEEEIDAIAPSVERGKWTFNAVGTVANAGQFTMYDADYGSGEPTGLFKSAKSIWFNEIDSDGTPHAFADVDDGELLEIFIDGSPEYGLYEVVGQAHDETEGATQFWVIDVNFVRTLETTTAVDTGELCRFKVFMAPTGGDASSFVLKAGDTMTGDLAIDKSENGPAAGGPSGKEATLTLKGDRTGTTHAIGTIQFGNASAPSKTGILAYRTDTTKGWFNINAELTLTRDGLKTNELSTYSGSILSFNKKMDFTSGDLNARFQKGFVIKKAGQGIDGSNILTAYNDFIEYDGPTNADNRIANRKWIWDNNVRDYATSKNWSETAGLYINTQSRTKVQNPGGSYTNKHNYEFLINAAGFGSFYVMGNDACVRNNFYVNSYAESNTPKGNRVATASNSRSMMSGLRQAILGATDFESLKANLLAKLEEMENSNEFSEEPSET